MNEQKTEQSETESVYDEIKVEKKVERTDSYFDGKVLELIGYGILSFLITAATLGIASAWAEKLLIAYKIDHTIYNGKRLKFEGTGTSLFVQRFKWIFFTIITLGIYSFWIPIRMEQWIVSNIHFEDETFVKGESYFDGGVLGVIGVNLLCNFLTIISLGILYPFGICYKQKWLAKHTIINRKGIVFNGSSLSLIGHYLLWWFLTVITFGIYGFWLPIKMENWKAQNTHIRLKGEEEPKTSMVPAIIAIIIFVVLVVCTLVSAIIKYNNIKSDDTSDKFYIEKVLLDFKNNVNNKNNGKNSFIQVPLNSSESTSFDDDNETTNTIKYTTNDFYRYTTVTLIDSVTYYGSPSHDTDVVASIENGSIAISESMGAVLIENTNAKYLYKVTKSVFNDIDLYFITKNNDLYVIHDPNSSNPNQQKIKVASGVAEFLGNGGPESIKVLLTDGTTENIQY